MTILANLNAKTKAIIRRDFLIDNFKGAYRDNAIADLLHSFAKKHMPEELANIEAEYNDIYEKRHQRIEERKALLAKDTEPEATEPEAENAPQEEPMPEAEPTTEEATPDTSEVETTPEAEDTPQEPMPEAEPTTEEATPDISEAETEAIYPIRTYGRRSRSDTDRRRKVLRRSCCIKRQAPMFEQATPCREARGGFCSSPPKSRLYGKLF